MHKLIIGAPFGNYITVPGVTSTIGTFTLHKRAGFFKRWWRVLSTVRYFRRTQSWINKLGLPNPGVDSVPYGDGSKILSIHGFDQKEWERLITIAVNRNPAALELNFSCPNVTFTAIQEAAKAADYARQSFGNVIPIIAKLPPIKWMEFVNLLHFVGINRFHLCNTIPTPGGGMSGKILKPYSLWAVEEVKQQYGNKVTVIGGGGVTCTQDIQDYLNAGADHVAVASTLLNPLNIRKLRGFRDYINERKP